MIDFESSIQQLVDGELSHQERSRFVEQLELQPELWRQVGLTLVESQVLNELLKPSGDNKHHDSSTRKSGNPQRGTEYQNRSSRIAPIAWLTTIAASLLLGFFVGNSTDSDRKSIAVQSPVASELPLPGIKHSEFADAIARSTTPIPVHFRRELLKAGFHVNELEKMKTVQSPVGGSVEIPIRQVEIKYLGNSIYQ